MIEIQSVSFNKNPCYTGEQIKISVDILYTEDRYIMPTYYKIFPSEYEKVDVNVQES